MKIETIAIHAGNHPNSEGKPAIQPITLSTTFEHHPEEAYIYTRAANPNRKSLENVLAKLEGGAEAAAFSSGNAAGMAVFQSLPVGSHVIAADDMYHGLSKQLKELFKGILEVTFVDLSNPDNFKNAIQPNTKLLWIETPSNPLLKISDIKALIAIAKSKYITVACDNTFATLYFPKSSKAWSESRDAFYH